MRSSRSRSRSSISLRAGLVLRWTAFQWWNSRTPVCTIAIPYSLQAADALVVARRAAGLRDERTRRGAPAWSMLSRNGRKPSEDRLTPLDAS